MDPATQCGLCIKARPDFDVLLQLLNNPRMEKQRRFWIANLEADEDNSDIEEDMGQERMKVKIAFRMPTIS